MLRRKALVHQLRTVVPALLATVTILALGVLASGLPGLTAGPTPTAPALARAHVSGHISVVRAISKPDTGDAGPWVDPNG